MTNEEFLQLKPGQVCRCTTPGGERRHELDYVLEVIHLIGGIALKARMLILSEPEGYVSVYPPGHVFQLQASSAEYLTLVE